ncbi:MAG: 6-carboxytetrahydropterin synthase [Nocardioides sp.]
MTFSLTVRDRMMVAHSLPGELFGPAQRLHGATYVVDLTVRADELGTCDVVCDLGALAGELRAALAELEYRNLDDEPAFAGVLTTTEVLARTLADRLAGRLADGRLGDVGHVRELEVTLRESDVAWASYRHPLGEPS